MICPECGEHLIGMESECPECGTRFNEEEEYDEWDTHGFADERDYWAWKEGR